MLMASMLLRQTTEDVTVGGLAVQEGTVIALCPKKVRRRHQFMFSDNDVHFYACGGAGGWSIQ